MILLLLAYLIMKTGGYLIMKIGGSSRRFSGGGSTNYFAETKCFAAVIWIE